MQSFSPLAFTKSQSGGLSSDKWIILEEKNSFFGDRPIDPTRSAPIFGDKVYIAENNVRRDR